MHAVRIGHGYHVIDDDALYKRLGTARVHFEVCPCSSVVTGSTKPSRDDHPLKRLVGGSGQVVMSGDLMQHC